MTRKTIKTILFASLIAAAVVSFSGMMMVYAADEDAKQRPDRTLRQPPGPMMDFDPDNHTEVNNHNPISDEERERLSKIVPHPANLSADITETAGTGHEAFGTLFDKDVENIRAIYSQNQVHVDGIELHEGTYLYAPTILGPNYSGLEIVTYYANEGNGTDKYVIVYNHVTQEFNWDDKMEINSEFIDSYTLKQTAQDFYFTEVLEYDDLWIAYIYSFDTHTWDRWDTESEDGPIEHGWMAWEEYYFDDNCPTILPEIKGKRMWLLHNETWKQPTEEYASEYDSGSVCGIENATFNSKYNYWVVGN